MRKWLRRIFHLSSSTKQEVNEEINVVISIAKAKKLYKELIVKSHPDKHPNNVELAKDITEQINNNRYNYSELLKLKEIINNKL